MTKLLIVPCAFLGALLVANMLPYTDHTAIVISGWAVSWGMVFACAVAFFAMQMRTGR